MEILDPYSPPPSTNTPSSLRRHRFLRDCQVHVCSVFTSIIAAYTVSSNIGIESAYAELSAASSRLLLDLKQAAEFPSGVLEFTDFTQGDDYIVKLVAVDTEFNMSSREE